MVTRSEFVDGWIEAVISALPEIPLRSGTFRDLPISYGFAHWNQSRFGGEGRKATMGIEAFVMNYRDGEVNPLSFQLVREIFDARGTSWNADLNYLNARFYEPDDYVDIYFGCDAASTGQVSGFTIVRPILHPDYLNRLYLALQLDNVMLFYSDETTPIFHPSGDPSHYPADLLAQLGTPRFANCPQELSHLSSSNGD